MALCKDPSITFLNKFGYNVIKLPRVGIEPMDIVGKDKSTEWLGKLSGVWKTTMAPPVPRPPQPAADVAGQQSDKLELSIGLKILENALRAFGASAPSLNFAFNKARKIQFTFGSRDLDGRRAIGGGQLPGQWRSQYAESGRQPILPGGSRGSVPDLRRAENLFDGGDGNR